MKLYRLEASDAGKLVRKRDFTRVIHREVGTSHSLMTPRTRDKAGPKMAATELEADPARWESAKKRLILAWAAMVSEPMPDEVCDEARLILYADPDLQLEYMGRGRFLNDAHLPANKTDLLTVDIAGGKRTYLLRRVNAPVGEIDLRLKNVSRRFSVWHEWINDPEARLVLALGGGGFRMFAATTILKVVDHLLVERRHVDEVWGSSGGAFLGYNFAHGIDPAFIDDFGFDLAHGRNPGLSTASPRSLLRANVNALLADLRHQTPTPLMMPWLDEMDRKHPQAERKHARIPFYALGTNTRRCEPIALAEPQDIPEYCRDIIMPCTSREAVAASTAVPFLLRPMRGITGNADDTWVDGSLTEENPLALPFVKWFRERQHAPEETPKKLKILSVHLNLRMSQSPLVTALSGLPILKQTRIVKHSARLMDTILDSKTHAPLQMLSAMPDVEVLACRLNLGWLNFTSSATIPAAMRSGRASESWYVTLYGAGKHQQWSSPHEDRD